MNKMSNKDLKISSDELMDWILILLAIIVVFFSYAINLIHLGETMDSDTATEILFGREMWLQKSLFPKDIYYTTELFLIRSAFFVSLWSFVTDNILNVYRLTITTEVLMEILSLIYLFKSLSLNNKSTALGLLIFFGTRTYLSANYIGMGGSSYATMHITAFLALGYYVKMLEERSGPIEKFLCFFIPIMALNFGISSIRMLVILFFPILFIHVWVQFNSRKQLSFKNDKILWELVLWIIIYLIGYNITLYYIIPKGFGPTYYHTVILSGFKAIILKTVPEILTEIFYVNPIFSIMIPFKFFSIEFLNGFLCLIYFIVLAYCLIYSQRKCSKSQKNIYKILLFGLFSFFVIILIFQQSAGVKIRYFMFVYVLASIVIAQYYQNIIYINVRLGKSLIIFITIFSMTNGIYNSLQLDELKNENKSKFTSNNASKIEEAFNRHGIKKGYSLYWDSSTVTVLSDSRVELAAVLGDMTPVMHLAPYRYFSPDKALEKTAFVKVNQPLSKEIAEHEQYKISKPDIFDLAVEKEVIYNDGVASVEIYYFDKNYFTFPPGHDPTKGFLAHQKEYWAKILSEIH
jgi:hypothetical protein